MKQVGIKYNNMLDQTVNKQQYLTSLIYFFNHISTCLTNLYCFGGKQEMPHSTPSPSFRASLTLKFNLCLIPLEQCIWNISSHIIIVLKLLYKLSLKEYESKIQKAISVFQITNDFFLQYDFIYPHLLMSICFFVVFIVHKQQRNFVYFIEMIQLKSSFFAIW